MMKILKSIGRFYKHITDSMGVWFYGLMGVLTIILSLGINDYIVYGDTIIIVITLSLMFIYHVMFFFDRIIKNKKKKK